MAAMAAEITLLCEGLVTAITGKSLDTEVNSSHMHFQVVLLSKSVVTVAADERLALVVNDAVVGSEVGSLPKAGWAHWARVWAVL